MTSDSVIRENFSRFMSRSDRIRDVRRCVDLLKPSGE